MNRRRFLKKGLISCASVEALGIVKLAQAQLSDTPPVAIETDYVRYVIGPAGQNLHFIDRQSGKDYCLQDSGLSFARVKINGRDYQASKVSSAGGQLTVHFGESGVSALLKVTARKHDFVFEVVSISNAHVEELVFLDLRLKPENTSPDAFTGCALALNLKTRVPEIPGINTHLSAMCYPRFGFSGAKVTVIGCPQARLRQVLKEAVLAAPELPHSPLGGPWALDAPINRGSYLFNFDGMPGQTVGEWVALAQKLGFTQIDFNGGKAFRFGDCRPNPQIYPHGMASLKAVIDKLHQTGIKAGLHTYSFFIDKTCPWVTPVPDPRLAKDAVFTLAKRLSADATSVPVEEPTTAMSTTTGFFVRNSVTLQIDDELIIYRAIRKQPPYAFLDCERGAYGTAAAPHLPGAKVGHLKECFGLFVPDAESTLFPEVAGKTADTFNECGFDMIYLDALDGEDVLEGAEYGWYYGSKFVYEIWKRLKRPALMEMSTFQHHLWCVRSRMGAWDHPRRGYKKFIDIHCEANKDLAKIFLPAQLGWWAVHTWIGPEAEPTFADDIEYLCGKALATDSGLSLMGVNPQNFPQKPAFRRLAHIFKTYESLRQANYFAASIKEKVRMPGAEFTLIKDRAGKWRFYPVQYAKHKVEGIDGWSNVWKTRNKYGRQPVQLRIEALTSAEPYDSPGNTTLVDFASLTDFNQRKFAAGITADLQISPMRLEGAETTARYTASNGNSSRRASWAKIGKIFSPTLDIGTRQGLGVWVHGDAQGEILNLQLRSPRHISTGIGEHYVIIDFDGWRYFELIEPEGSRYSDYVWPYGDPISIYRESVNYAHVESLGLWLNNLPPHRQVACSLGPIKALPLVKAKLRNPALTIGDRTITFPTEIETGCYLEFLSESDCKLYSPDGKLLSEIKPTGPTLVLEEGENDVRFSCQVSPDVNPRASVTITSRGLPIE
ncbi:MAG: hypothetical protein M1404_07970 [Acidobacteria bacterium]|nr:hypothetical protein [Acidobacteriota bacterium]